MAVTALVFVLLLGTAAAFALAERLKLERSPVTAPRLTRLIGPTCGCEKETADLAVRLREPHVVDAAIVDMEGEHVRTLASDLRRPRGVMRVAWDGRDDDGDVVPDGRYRLSLHLDGDDRTIVVPTPIRVDTTPPRLRLLSATPRAISPDRDGRGDRVLFRYRSSEPSYAVVSVNGREILRGRFWSRGPGRVRWGGRMRGRPVPSGMYTTSIHVVDAAGNASEPSVEVPVRVRYAELLAVPRRVRVGGVLRFRIDADAREVPILIASTRGRRTPILLGRFDPGPVEVRLRPSLRPGRYVLMAGGHDRTVIRIVR